MGNKFYTPDGFTDLLPGLCAYKRGLENKLRVLYSLHGYDEIETPGIEYCDIYTQSGFVPEEELYKFTDSSGRLLCTRYDGTIPAVRFITGRNETFPVRISYIENMYRAGKMGGGKQSGFTQAGIELMGAKGAASDAEVLALAIKSALEIGITDLQISVGQSAFFAGLKSQMNMTDEQATDICEAIKRRDSVTIDNQDLKREDKDLLLAMTEMSGTYDVLDYFMPKVTDKVALDALTNLKEILDIMDKYDFLKYINIDLGLMGSEEYYTGMIFKGFTYEVGFPIISGGRYDEVSKAFGKDISSVGFSISLTLALTALMRQDKLVTEPAASVICGGDFDAACMTCEALRAEGTAAILDTTGLGEEELNEYAKARGIETVMYLKGGEA